MNRESFLAERRPRWEELERLLALPRWLRANEWARLATLYRAVCADLARAQGTGLGDDIRHYLDELAGRAHNRLYGARQRGALRLFELVGREFPREVRASAPFMLLATVLFYGPMLIGVIGPWVDPGFAAAVLPPAQLAQFEAMYSEQTVRGSGEDAAMAGFYVLNNVGIALRCFATGALFGLGSIFYLVYNGLILGTVAGWLLITGLSGNFLAFVSGHASWELTAVVVAGGAGLRLGWALIDTGGRTRAGSVRHHGPALYRLVVGVAAMLVVAALIEGFWSAGPVPFVGKLVFGAVQWVVVIAWLLLGGRREAA